MEIRNIQKTGGASFVLTLPKEWIKKQNLKDKDKLNIFIQKSGYLIVQPYTTHKLRPIATVHIDTLSKEQIQRELIGYYVSGVEEIIILSKKITHLQRTWIREIIQGLIGFDFLEGTSERIVLKNILDAKEFSIVHNVNRILMIIQSMFADLVVAYETKDLDLAKDIIERDNEVDRLHTAILRQFNYFLQHMGQEEVLGLSLPDVHYYERAAIRLERLADHIVKLCEIFTLGKSHFTKDYNRYLHKKVKNTKKMIEECISMVQNLDKKNAHGLLDKYIHATNKLSLSPNWQKRSPTEDLIENSLQRISSYVMNIAEETINYSNTKNNIFVI